MTNYNWLRFRYDREQDIDEYRAAFGPRRFGSPAPFFSEEPLWKPCMPVIRHPVEQLQDVRSISLADWRKYVRTGSWPVKVLSSTREAVGHRAPQGMREALGL